MSLQGLIRLTRARLAAFAALAMAALFSAIESFDARTVFFGSPVDGHTRLEMASLSPTGTESVVKGMPRIAPMNWDILRDGVYFFPDDAIGTLSYFDFEKQTVRVIRKFGAGGFFGISISPDARYSLGCRTESGGQEIMLVNNFP